MYVFFPVLGYRSQTQIYNLLGLLLGFCETDCDCLISRSFILRAESFYWI